MSNVSNRHSVIPFKAGITKPLSDQRLAKVGYKSTEKNKAKYPSIAVSVPKFVFDPTPENVSLVRGIIEEKMADAQDGIIRSLYESSDGTLLSVSDDDISFRACVNFLNAESEGGRLTKAFLEQWFDANVHDNLFVVIAEKLGFNDPNPEQEIVIGNKVKVYKELISALSGGATTYVPQQIQGVRRALEIASVDDDTAKKLEQRLKKMETPVKIEEMLEL